LLLLLAVALPLAARTKDKLPYGEGLIVNISLPESEVEQVVEDVSPGRRNQGNQGIQQGRVRRGRESRRLPRTRFRLGPGRERFSTKSAMQAIDPRNFKDSGDVGTITVRYVVVPSGARTHSCASTRFLQKTSATPCTSPTDRSKAAEYKDIREHLDQHRAHEKAGRRGCGESAQERLAKKQNLALGNNAPAAESASIVLSGTALRPRRIPIRSHFAARGAIRARTGRSQDKRHPRQTTEERVKDLRKQVVRLVKSPGAPLKSAPFHTATTMQLLGAGTEVLIRDLHAILVRRGNTRRTARMDAARSVGATAMMRQHSSFPANVLADAAVRRHY
jgi:hypothetical protein